MAAARPFRLLGLQNTSPRTCRSGGLGVRRSERLGLGQNRRFRAFQEWQATIQHPPFLQPRSSFQDCARLTGKRLSRLERKYRDRCGSDASSADPDCVKTQRIPTFRWLALGTRRSEGVHVLFPTPKPCPGAWLFGAETFTSGPAAGDNLPSATQSKCPQNVGSASTNVSISSSVLW